MSEIEVKKGRLKTKGQNYRKRLRENERPFG